MALIERFLKYISFETSSDASSDSCPSTPGQFELGRCLVDELQGIGLENTGIDKYGYVYGFLPASEGCNAAHIGFIAHMDVSPDVSGANIKPRTIRYEGGDIKLSETQSIKASDFESLENYIGHDLILTDGSTLLGADDKAGVAEIITALEYLIAHPEIPHGPISVAFTPDEEIGRGADRFDFERFGAEYAYTVDGGALGELEYENFNAASACIKIHGVNIHPGSAKNKMKNAVLIGTELISMMPPTQTPAHTEGYEGFFHVGDFNANETLADISMIIRDHDMQKFEEKKNYLQRLVHYLNDKYGAGTVELAIKDSYYNMKEKILPVMHIVERAKGAMRKAGVEPIIKPIRGGTDGARLSFEGLPCPNISTGGENFHGVHEFISIQSMHKMVEVIVNIARAPEE